jgi:hypothetical protein
VTPGGQLGLDLGEVVDLAVVGDDDRAVLVVEGLLAGGEIDDGQALVGEPDPRLDL